MKTLSEDFNKYETHIKTYLVFCQMEIVLLFFIQATLGLYINCCRRGKPVVRVRQML